MNQHKKLQKFSIRKYAIGTVSTLVATFVFLGVNHDAQASEHLNPLNNIRITIQKIQLTKALIRQSNLQIIKIPQVRFNQIKQVTLLEKLN